MGGGLFVPHVDDADALEHAPVEEPDDVTAREGEDGVDPFVLEGAGQDLSAVDLRHRRDGSGRGPGSCDPGIGGARTVGWCGPAPSGTLSKHFERYDRGRCHRAETHVPRPTVGDPYDVDRCQHGAGDPPALTPEQERDGPGQVGLPDGRRLPFAQMRAIRVTGPSHRASARLTLYLKLRVCC